MIDEPLAPQYHLAQINVAHAIDTLDSETLYGFTSRLDEINALAESAPGFIWRLTTPAGDPSLETLFDDPLIITNLSVWESQDHLSHFVYKTSHTELIKGKRDWFHKTIGRHQALWWIKAGHIPTPEEGKQKLQQLSVEGPSENVFLFSKPFSAPES